MKKYKTNKTSEIIGEIIIIGYLKKKIRNHNIVIP